MANGADRFLLLGKSADQGDYIAVNAQVVRVSNSSGKDQRIEIVGIDVVDREVRTDRLAGIIVYGCLDWIELQRCEHDFGAALLQELARTEQLPLLEAISRDDEHSGITNRWH